MKSKDVLALADKIAGQIQGGKSATQCFQEALAAGSAPADLVRVEAVLYNQVQYGLQESDEIVTLLGAMSPEAAQRARALREMESGLTNAFLGWLGGDEDVA